MKCKTVIIETENGLVTINEEDFDEKKHTLFLVEEEKPKPKAKPKKTKSKK